MGTRVRAAVLSPVAALSVNPLLLYEPEPETFVGDARHFIVALLTLTSLTRTNTCIHLGQNSNTYYYLFGHQSLGAMAVLSVQLYSVPGVISVTYATVNSRRKIGSRAVKIAVEQRE